MTKVIHGKINGRTIELSEDLGLAPGEEVEVQIRKLPATGKWDEGLRRCSGAIADGSPARPPRTVLEILDEIAQNRFKPDPGGPSVVDMLREDRNR